jgi:hypothetical protein
MLSGQFFYVVHVQDNTTMDKALYRASALAQLARTARTFFWGPERSGGVQRIGQDVALGSTHFKLLINDDIDQVAGVRGGGNCALYAVFLGYLAIWPNQTQFQRFRQFVRQVLGLVETMPDNDWQKEVAIFDLQQVLANKANIINTIEYLYPIMANLLDCKIQLKHVNDNEKRELSTDSFNESGTRSMYLTTNNAHVSLYLQNIPPAENYGWHEMFNHMWTVPPHPLIKTFTPVLSTSATWESPFQ